METVKVNQTTQVEVEVWSAATLVAFAADLAGRSALVFADLWKMAQQLVFKAYSSTDDLSVMYTEILNSFNASPRVQDALYHYLKRAGINASRPAPGSTQFIVGGVLDRGYQEKAFDFVRRIPPMSVERKIVTPKGPKVLKGTAVERARYAVGKLIERMKKDDPLGAAEANDMLTEHDCCLFTDSGEKVLLTKDEIATVLNMLTLMADDRFGGFKIKDAEPVLDSLKVAA